MLGILGMMSSLKLRFHSAIQLLGIKKGVTNNVFGKINISYPHNLAIGNSCSFNHGVYINALNPIILGDDVTMSAGSKLISSGIDYISWANGIKRHTSNKGIHIGDHVWIGANAIILPGVSITGKYVVIAANAVLTKNVVDDYVVVAGCPAKIIRSFKAV